MPITLLRINNNIPGDKAPVRENPQWSEIEGGIRSLDGGARTEASLLVAEAVGMHIVGGRQQMYFCEIITRAHNYTLIDPHGSHDRVVEVAVGEEFEEYHAVGLESVIKAAMYYSQTEALDQTLTWEVDLRVRRVPTDRAEN